MNISSYKKLATLCKSLRDSEMQTIAQLECPMKIRKSRNLFQVEVTLRGFNSGETPPEARISCKMVFICPKFYPRVLPEVYFKSKKNFPSYLEHMILEKFYSITHQYWACQYIIPTVANALSMIEREEAKVAEHLKGHTESRGL